MLHTYCTCMYFISLIPQLFAFDYNFLLIKHSTALWYDVEIFAKLTYNMQGKYMLLISMSSWKKVT